jgi:glycosyltransferase involved in cell wall biosynthesis
MYPEHGMEKSLSIVLLCHNERENLPTVIEQVESALLKTCEQGQADSVEVVVVNDGSNDGTEQWLHEQQLDVPLVVVSHDKRRGYGAAVRSGLAKAQGARVAYMDGDGQFEPIQIMDMLLLMDAQQADMVAGIRTDRQDSMYRRSVGWIYNVAVRRWLGLSYKDLDCGFKLLNRKALESLNLQLVGNLLGPEMLNQLESAGCKIVQMPVRHRARQHGKAKGADIFALQTTVLDLLKSATSRKSG